MKSVMMFHVVLMTVFLHFVASQECPPGTFLYTTVHTDQHFCIECQDGTYMPYKDHQQPSCRPCEKIKDPELEILVSPCNKTHDAVIHCVDGYYRDEARNPREKGQCKKCTKCEFTGQPCSTYRDTVCCWDENFDVVLNHDGVPVCRERPWFCRRGEYFNTLQWLCFACPDNTFMPLDFHIESECWKCREYDKHESYRPLHSVIIQPCNSTHAPVIRCEDGFYMNPKMSYTDDALGCSPCTDCSTTDVQYEGRKCDGMEDTVCCPQPIMTVVDTPDGPVCSALSDDCGGCRHYHVRKRSTRCAPCTSSADTGVTDFTNRPTELENTTAKVPFICDNKNAARPVIQTESLIIGLATGALATLVLLSILLIFYMKYLRHRAVFKMWEAKIIRLYFESPMTVQNRARDLDDEDTEARQPLTKDTSSSFENHQTSSTLPDDREVEMTFGHDDDLRKRKEKCKKSSNHAKFTHVKDFPTSNLPPNYRHFAESEHIKTICDLTVRIRVQHISEDRPYNDPNRKFAGLVGLNRCGSGLVFQMSKEYGEVENQRCPCYNCQADPRNTRKSWAEFLVATSAQLVFDDTECRKASCILWFNEDKDDMSPAPSLKGRKMKTVMDKDVCIMHCVTHFQEVSEKLKNMVNHFNQLYQRYRLNSSGQAVDQLTTALVISHPHGLSKRISVGKATAKMDGKSQKWTIDAQICPGSLGAPVCLIGKEQNPETGDEQSSEIWTTIYTGDNECKEFSLEDLPM